MAELIPELFDGMAIALESAFKTAGSYATLSKAAKKLAATPGREQIEYGGHFDQYGDREPGTPGFQSVDASAEIDLHTGSQSELDLLLTAALGEKDAGGAITFATGPDETSFTYTDDDPSPLIRGTASNGKKYFLPVRHLSAGTATLDASLPTGVTLTAVSNPSALSGACYNYDDGGEADTFTVAADHRKTGGHAITAKGCAVEELSFIYERGRRLAFGVKWKGAEYARANGLHASVGDASRVSSYFLAGLGDIWLVAQATAFDLGAAPTERVLKLAFDLAPPLLEHRASIGLDGGTTLAGSDLCGFTRLPGFDELVRATIYPTDFDAWFDKYEDQTALKLFGVFHAGTAGDSPLSTKAAVYMPEVIVDEIPRFVIENGARALELGLRVRRRLTTANNVERCHFALANF